MTPRLLPAAAAGPLLVAALLSGCSAPSERPVIRPLPPLGRADQVAPPRLDGAVGGTDRGLPEQISYGRDRLPSIRQGAPGGAEGGPGVSLDFADTDIRDAVAQILGAQLHVTYTIDPAVKGTVTLHTAVPLSPSQLLPTLQVLLAQVGASLLRTGDIYRVVAGTGGAGAPGSGAGAAGLAGGAAMAGSVMVPLRYAGAEDLAKTLQPFVQPGARILPVAGSNALLVNADPTVRGTLVDLIAAFDIDVLAGQSYALLPVESGGAKDMASALQDALHGRGGALSQMVRVVAMSRVDAVLVVAGEARYVDEARRLFRLVEAQRRVSLRSWHVYYLQNSRSNDAAYVLQQAFTPGNVTAQPTPTLQAASQSSTQIGGSLASSSSGLGSTSSTGTGLGGTTTTAQAQPAQAQPAQATSQSGANPLLGGLDSSGGAADAHAMRIIPNPQNNALLVYATDQENDAVSQMLRKIDILPLQVRIDAVIAEVQLNDNLQYGTQFFFKSGGINGELSTATGTVTGALTSAALGTTLPGFVLASSSGGAPFALSALQSVTTVHVLSSPELLVLDNQPAHLQVGQLVPIQTGSESSTVTAGSVYNQYTYQPTGVIMQVTPRVNDNGLVTLDISQEVSSVATAGTSTTNPTFNDQSVASRVVVQDGQTIGLAGLITDQSSRGNAGIPWLKDIPVLGLLGSTQTNARTRTELLILITPHVMHDQHDARALTEDLRDTLINAAAVPYELTPMKQTGSADPQARLRRDVGLGP